MPKLPNEILDQIHSKVAYRPSNKDSNFNFIHQEDVFIIAGLAYEAGRRASKNVDEARETNKESEAITLLRQASIMSKTLGLHDWFLDNEQRINAVIA
jgi:hypothetical protein